MLSGKYRSESVCRHWSANKTGLCLLPNCSSPRIVEDVTHILLSCPSLTTMRSKMMNFFLNFSSSKPCASKLILKFLGSDNLHFQTQFLLDCSVFPDVITHQQFYGDEVLHVLFYITRTWCYTLHRERLRLLGRWGHS